MLEKNFNIRVRSVNEAHPMTSYNTQNLFKLPHEKKNRTYLISEQLRKRAKDERNRSADAPPPSDRPGTQIKSQRNDERYNRNVSLHLLNETDSEESECNVKTEQEIIDDFKKTMAPKREADCKTAEELKQFYLELEQQAEKVEKQKRFK